MGKLLLVARLNLERDSSLLKHIYQVLSCFIGIDKIGYQLDVKASNVLHCIWDRQASCKYLSSSIAFIIP